MFLSLLETAYICLTQNYRVKKKDRKRVWCVTKGETFLKNSDLDILFSSFPSNILAAGKIAGEQNFHGRI